MRILIVDVYYPNFLRSFYYKNPKLKTEKFERHKRILMDEMFGTADFYSRALIKLGYPTNDVILNNEYLQKAWTEEHEISSLNFTNKIIDVVISKIPAASNRVSLNWELKILSEQIEDFKPDILYSHNLGYINPTFLKKIKPQLKMLVGQIASPVPPFRNLKIYDLIITSLPHFVEKFQKMGINSEYLPLCFESSILKKLPKQKRKYELTFVGGISRAHKEGLRLLNGLAQIIKFDVWGYGKEELERNSNLYKFHHGEAWGKDMYNIMLQSKITINRHIDIAEDYANNMRLYEATGCGAMLITDKKKNLSDFFKIDKEIISYEDTDDLIEKIRYYLKKDKEREAIASAGQKRTLKDHNYSVRMKELVNILEKYI